VKRNIIPSILLFIIISRSGLYGINPVVTELVSINSNRQDTLKENQILYNGRIWKNLYYMVQEDQFLFSRKFLSGSVTVRGKTFGDISLMYDLFKDEILTPISTGGILQLNKEMVDSFSILYQNKTYRFTRFPEDSLEGLKGYVNVRYKGKIALYIKYSKKIDRQKTEGENDKFYLITRIFILKDDKVYLVTGKSDLFKVLNEDKAQIKNFIKKNNLLVSKKEPESFIPVLRFYDSISQ
jgi:hypothetical protein